MKRPHHSDIARVAGVSKGAVSLRLTAAPAFSVETRARILGIARARRIPAAPARALSSDRAEAVGPDRRSRPELVATRAVLLRMVAGVEKTLSDAAWRCCSPSSPTARESILYRRWWGGRRWTGLLLFDMRMDDPTAGWLRKVGAPRDHRRPTPYAGISCTRPTTRTDWPGR